MCTPMDSSDSSCQFMAAIRRAGVELRLRWHRPATSRSIHLAVLCHGLPMLGTADVVAGQGLERLGREICADLGWPVCSPELRGVGGSGGEFSLTDWRDDLSAVLDALMDAPVSVRVWLVGFSLGGSLAVSEAARRREVAGLVVISAPGWFPPAGLEDEAPRPDCTSFDRPSAPAIRRAVEFLSYRPVEDAKRMEPRRCLVVHGDRDRTVPLEHGRRYGAAIPGSDFVVIAGGRHSLLRRSGVRGLVVDWLRSASGLAGASRQGAHRSAMS